MRRFFPKAPSRKQYDISSRAKILKAGGKTDNRPVIERELTKSLPKELLDYPVNL